MPNRVVLGTIRRIMGYADLKADFIRQLLAVRFEARGPRTVATAALTPEPETGGGGIVIMFRALACSAWIISMEGKNEDH
jgi:hypothetical protein